AVVHRARSRLGSCGPRALVQSVPQIIGAALGEGFVKVVIDLQGRRARAGADAFHLLERKHAIGGDLFISDLQLPLYKVVDFIAAAKHAGNVGAYLDVVLARRFAPDHGVISERFIDLQETHAEARGDLRYHGVAYAAKSILRVESTGHERRALERVTLHERLELLFECEGQLHQRSTAPRTISIVPMQAIMSATRRRSESLGSAWRLTKEGARTLTR